MLRRQRAEPLPETGNGGEQPPIEGEDFYWEGPYVVFTEAYHLRRGSCCGSGCRHCPWRGREEKAESGDSAQG